LAICQKLNRHVTLLPNGIDTEQFQRRRSPQEAKCQWGFAPSDFVLGGVGRLAEEKRFEWILQAVQELRRQGIRACALIVGTGEQEMTLRSLSRQLGVEPFVHWAGYLADVRPAYEAMDVFCLPSLREGMPNVLLEAMAMEVPVVATDLEGVRQILANSTGGQSIAIGDFTAFVKAISGYLENPVTRSQVSIRNRAAVCEHFCFLRRVERAVEIYQLVLRVREHYL
jgi:glycosyltransferase involved in cell wall biosynthesis